LGRRWRRSRAPGYVEVGGHLQARFALLLPERRVLAVPHPPRSRGRGVEGIPRPPRLRMYFLMVALSRPTVDRNYPRAQKCCPTKLRILVDERPGNVNRALPLHVPDNLRAGYFGGIEINMCTWSGIRWPPITWHSFCFAKALNTSPNRRRSPRSSVLFRYFGISTRWHLHCPSTTGALSRCM
jgi:hypothetical protein